MLKIYWNLIIYDSGFSLVSVINCDLRLSNISIEDID